MPEFTWDTNDGAVGGWASGLDLTQKQVMPLTRLPAGLVTEAQNVELLEGVILKPRNGVTAFSTSGSEPTSEVKYLFQERVSATEALWAFATTGGAPMTAHRFDGSTWTAVSLSDTVATSAEPHAVRYNGKVFLAYNSDVNRLHVWDGTSVRRVGIGLVAAATVANTGAGAYAATIRYYKVQQAILSGTTVLASSELSASVSFTPSGAGTAARVTKPTTIDSATHWRVYGSADGITYYALNAYTVVATTTFDDSTAPASYNTLTGLVAPEVGLFVPPPSAKFLVSDGERLIMASAHETTAGAGETTPKSNRVWFTRPLGATDEGDDEAITSTSGNRYWLDIEDPYDGIIQGMAALGGFVYVFFARSIWRLVSTGTDDTPFRAEQVTAGVGAISQLAIAVGSTGGNIEDAIYCVSQVGGLCRVSAGGGLEWLGRGVLPRVLPANISDVSLVYDPQRRDLWIFLSYNGGSYQSTAIDVSRLVRRGLEFHGGARLMTFQNRRYRTASPFGNGMVFAGVNTQASTYTIDENATTTTTDAGSAFTCVVRGPAFQIPLRHVSALEPVVQVRDPNVALTVRLSDPFRSIAETRSVSITTPAAVGLGGAIARVEGLGLDDGSRGVYVSLECLGNGPVVESVTVPYIVQEPL